MTLMPHDAAVAARDPGLPGLALLLDPDRLAEILARSLPDAGLSELGPSYLRYKPGTSCLAGFTAETAQGRIDLAAKAYKPRRYAVERARPVPEALRSAVRPVALNLDEAAVLVRLVPYDRDLRPLPRLVDPERRQALLGKLVPDLAGADWRLLRHKPGRRCIGVLATEGRVQAIVKLYGKAHFDQARRGARFAAGMGGPALLGSSRRHGILVSAWQPGRSLADFEPEGPLAVPSMAAAGRALAALHAADPGDLPPRTFDDDAAAIDAAARALAWIAPDLAPRTRRLATRLNVSLGELAGRTVPLHGDFSADQVVVGDGAVRLIEVSLIDWDRACRGRAALDLGSFLGRLEADALAAGRARPEEAALAFAEGYDSAAGHRPQGLRSCTAAALFCLTSEPFRQRHPDWPALVRALLDSVERLVERQGSAFGDPMPARRRVSA